MQSIRLVIDKPLIHFKENAKVLSLGSWGCNFRCLGCQNVNLSWSETGDGLGFREMAAGDVIEMALKNDCRGICFTYNEPAILPETVENIAYKARETTCSIFLSLTVRLQNNQLKGFHHVLMQCSRYKKP